MSPTSTTSTYARSRVVGRSPAPARARVVPAGPAHGGTTPTPYAQVPLCPSQGGSRSASSPAFDCKRSVQAAPPTPAQSVSRDRPVPYSPACLRALLVSSVSTAPPRLVHVEIRTTHSLVGSSTVSDRTMQRLTKIAEHQCRGASTIFTTVSDGATASTSTTVLDGGGGDPSFAILPQTVTDPGMALPALRDSGAVVVSTVVGDGENEAALREKATSLTREVFGESFVMAKEPCAIRSPPPNADADTAALFSPTGVGAEPLRPHNDGWDVYGELSPDYLMLFCVNPADRGGESFLLDGVRIGDAIGDERLFAVDVETAFPRVAVRPGEDKWTATWRSPMIDRNGQRAIVRSGKGDQAVGGDPVGELLRELYTDEIQKHSEVAPKFTLQRGQALVVDNCE
jgi:hypothetical protein